MVCLCTKKPFNEERAIARFTREDRENFECPLRLMAKVIWFIYFFEYKKVHIYTKSPKIIALDNLYTILFV